MTKAVLDASAVLAAINDEPGGEVVLAAMGDAVVSAVNFAEIVSKLAANGLSGDQAVETASGLTFEIAAVDGRQAELAGRLHAGGRRQGVSMGDAFCLALAATLGAPALTADRRWASLDLGVEVTLIR
jgi:PIN domain nuclease of toxin-antitoxin system